MRDANDTLSAELPGLPPYAPAPAAVRTNATTRAAAVEYQSPKQRQACRNCRHLREHLHNTGSLAEHVSTHCGKHRFPVQLGGICAEHEA